MRDSDLDRPQQDLDAEIIKRALHAVNNLVVITDPRRPDNPIVWVNDHFCEFTGYTREEVIGRNCRFLQGEDRDQPERRTLRDAIAREEAVHVLLRNYTKDGRLFWNDLYVSPVRGDDGAVLYFVGIQNDGTAREEAREEVREREREVHETAENERERMGMDLHDGLGQTLAGLRLLTASLAQRLRDAGSEEAAAADRVTGLLGQAIAEARQMALGLNPIAASLSGLADALRELAHVAAEAAGPEGPRVVARVEEFPFEDRRQARHLFRIAQEAVHNALEHAHAAEIVVTLHRTGRAVQLEVRDDGVGLPPARRRAPGERRSMGLDGMRHRAELLGARLDLLTPEGGGTAVRLTLPLDAAPESTLARTAERERPQPATRA